MSMKIEENTVANWSKGGKEKILSILENVYRTTTTLSNSEESGAVASDEFTELLYDLLSFCLTGKLDPEEMGDFCVSLDGVLGTNSGLSSVVTDVLAILDAEVACNENKSQRMALKSLIRSVVGIVGDDLLKERLDMDTLEVSGIIPSKSTYNQKYVKTKTKLFYKQQKFNLYREESEGYSKLLCELGHESLSGVDANSVLESIKSLIGRFSLDPNRTLDVILEAFERHLEDRSFYASLLSLYPCEQSTFVNILGFKYQSYQGSDDSITPSSLYQLTSILLEEGLVPLEALYSHLLISEEDLENVHKTVMDDARNVLKKANIVSLIEKSDEEKEKEADAAQAQKDRIDRLLSLSVNQKLGLCHACLLQGNWESAVLLFNQMPPFLPMWSPCMVKALCSLINHVIEPLYRHISPRGTKSTFVSTLPTAQCYHNFNDLLSFKVFDMLHVLGPKLHSDPLLLCKIVRIGKACFKDLFTQCSPSDGNGGLKYEVLEKPLFRSFLSVLDEVILPSLSMLQCNCGIAEEVWSMIRILPYETRYMLYGYWKNSNYGEHPDLMKIKASTITKGRYIMKRLTKDNVKPSGRQIGKLSHNNPGIIFDYVLSQIQKYDNIIIPVVDSLKYLTPIAYDVLAYCVIEALGNPLKERMKHEDTNLSSWLQGLASFCANVFKKYPIDLAGLLQYITNQLKAGKSFDLLVLKEVIQKMAGIEISDEVTPSQLEAMAGGELLKVEGGYFSQVRNTKKSSQRLREALVDSNLCLPLFILSAQQRDCIIFRDGSKMHLKLVGSMYDHCMDTLVQFGAFLSSHLSPEEYGRRVFDLNVLIEEYRMPGDIAFYLYRPKLTSLIGLKFSELEKASKSEKQDRKSIMGRQEKNFCSASEEVLGPVIEAVKPLQPPKVWEDINCKLYVVFWALTLYDLHVPKERYEEEISKAKDAITALENNQEMPSSKKKKEQERSEALINRLQEEKKRQEDNNQLILGWLRQEKDSLFNPKVTKNRTLTQFLQLCIFPRCCFTTTDAVYCAKFIQTLHSLETPQFSTLLFLDRTFSDLSYTVSCCTESEVRRYGHFLSQLLSMVSRWQSSKSCYEDECAGTPGFISMMRSASTINDSKQYLDFENYRHITFKWHFKLTKSLVICLESKDYIQIRNGLLLLTKVLPHYPKVHHLSLALEKRVEKIIEEEKEKRPDLYILAIGYAGMLKTQKANLVSEQDFHKKSEIDSKPVVTSKKVEKREDTRVTHSSTTATVQLNGGSKESDKVKALKDSTPSSKSPLRATTTSASSKMELKLTKIDKEDKAGLLSPISVGSSSGGSTTDDKKTPLSKTVTAEEKKLSSKTTEEKKMASKTTTATEDKKTTLSKTSVVASGVDDKKTSVSKTTTTATEGKKVTRTISHEDKKVATKPTQVEDKKPKMTDDKKTAKTATSNEEKKTTTLDDKKIVGKATVTDDKKAPTKAMEDKKTTKTTTAAAANVRSSISPAKSGQRRSHVNTNGAGSDSNEKESKRRKMEDSSSKVSGDAANKTGSTQNDSKDAVQTKKKISTPVSAAAASKDSTGTKDTATVKLDRKRERPPEKDEAVKKRRESMEPPSTNPGTVPAATFKEPRVSVGGNEVVKDKKRVLKVTKPVDKEKSENTRKRTKSPAIEESPKRHVIKQNVKK